LAPTLEEVAKDLGGTVKVVKMNVDDSPEAPGRYGIRSIPTLILFKEGQVVAQNVGGLPKAQLRQWAEQVG
jgi:thioredoxin 1